MLVQLLFKEFFKTVYIQDMFLLMRRVIFESPGLGGILRYYFCNNLKDIKKHICPSAAGFAFIIVCLQDALCFLYGVIL